MKLGELLNKLNDEEVAIQALLPAVKSIKAIKRGGSVVTFGTDGLSAVDLIHPTKVALVVFIDRAAWDREHAANAAAKAAGEPGGTS